MSADQIWHTGIVLWFSRSLGYGFIRVHKSAEDVFVHRRHINLTELGAEKTLLAGAAVRFHIRPGTKGPEAWKVHHYQEEADRPPIAGAGYCET